MNDVIIVGAGAAAAGAALGLSGRKVLMLDCGILPTAGSVARIGARLPALRKGDQDLYPALIGEHFEAMTLVDGKSSISPKLKSPYMKYITKDWESISPVLSQGFDTQMSFSYGGLANGWGAGAYRFTDNDLRGFPICATHLEPYFDILTAELGINGTSDDLAAFFGKEEGLLPPLKLNRSSAVLYNSYKSNRAYFNKKGLTIGRPRLAVLSKDHKGRARYKYNNLEFFSTEDRAIYTPTVTLDRLRNEGAIQYENGWLVESYRETPHGVQVTARRIDAEQWKCFEAKKLILAAGCLNSSKIVLASCNEQRSSLPLLDNQISYVPLINPRLIGARHEQRCFGMGQLNIIYSDAKASEPVQGTIYDVSGPLRSDLLFDFPLPFSSAFDAAKLLTPALCLIQYFYPDDPCQANRLELNENGHLKIAYSEQKRGLIERATLSAFLKTGWIGLPQLCRYPKAGNSYHYAGTLPMKVNPGLFETFPDGRLQGTRNVHVVDASVFTRLPSKNLTFTSMANAMRIATEVALQLQ